MKTVDTFGFSVFSDDLSLIPLSDSECKTLNTISPNSYGLTVGDKEFEMALKNSDFLVLDGVYFALSSIMLQGKNIKRNQGPDVFKHFMSRAESVHGRVFFMGSTDKTLRAIKKKVHQDYSNISVETYSPPFKDEFSNEDDLLILEAINSFEPDIVFVGMTCPKQEKWAVKNRDKINAKMIISIGNVFDWYAGTQRSIHPFWFKIRLGWLVRIFLRPEVFRRNIGNQMTFFWHLVLVKFKFKNI